MSTAERMAGRGPGRKEGAWWCERCGSNDPAIGPFTHHWCSPRREFALSVLRRPAAPPGETGQSVPRVEAKPLDSPALRQAMSMERIATAVERIAASLERRPHG